MILFPPTSTKKFMDKQLRSKKVDTRCLFHGTKKEHIKTICEQGFDPRVSGSSSGTVYGEGTYFARDAIYSSGYSVGNKMFLARVLVGCYTAGKRGVRRPPKKLFSEDLYDSCVDDKRDPEIFVVFKQEQAYPEWLIEYAKK